MTQAPTITIETPDDVQAVGALVDKAFGPGRFAKTAERLREGSVQCLQSSVVARQDGQVVGCAQMWPVHVGATPALLLGPFAVDESQRKHGLGKALVNAACEAAQTAGHGLVILVGDAAFFQRVGFHPVDPKAVSLPGPVDMARVLVRELTPGAAAGLAGLVTAG